MYLDKLQLHLKIAKCIWIPFSYIEYSIQCIQIQNVTASGLVHKVG